MGQSPPSSSYNEKKNGLPFFQGKAEFGDLYPQIKKYCNKPKKIAEKNDTLLSVRAPVGPTNLAPEKSCIGRGLAAIRAIDSVDYKFIFYLLRSKGVYLSGKGTGTTFKAITKDFLFDLDIAFPSLPEQGQVILLVEQLFSDLDNAIDNLKKAKDQLKVYRQSVLKYAFEGKLKEKQSKWNRMPLSKACEIKPSKKEVNNLPQDLNVSFLPMPNVSENGKIIKHDERKLKAVRKGYTYFKNGDVLLAKITPCFENGKKAIAEDLINGIGFGSTEFHVLRPLDNVLSKWIFYAVSLESFRNEAILQMTGAVGQKRVPSRIIEEFEILIPSPEEQKSIVQEIESRFSVCDKMEETINNSLEQAEALRQSILKQAFEGKLTEEWRKEHPELISGKNSAKALLEKIKEDRKSLERRNTKKGR